MIVPTSLLSNVAAVGQDGLLYVEGGGWEFTQCPAFPWAVTGFVAGIVELSPDEIDTPRIVKMSVRDHNDNDLGASGTFIVHSPRKMQPFALPFSIVVHGLGAFHVDLSDDNGVFSSLTCGVRYALPPGDEPLIGREP